MDGRAVGGAEGSHRGCAAGGRAAERNAEMGVVEDIEKMLRGAYESMVVWKYPVHGSPLCLASLRGRPAMAARRAWRRWAPLRHCRSHIDRSGARSTLAERAGGPRRVRVRVRPRPRAAGGRIPAARRPGRAGGGRGRGGAARPRAQPGRRGAPLSGASARVPRGLSLCARLHAAARGPARGAAPLPVPQQRRGRVCGHAHACRLRGARWPHRRRRRTPSIRRAGPSCRRTR